MARTLQIRQIAFRFGGHNRVFPATKLTYEVKPKRDTWTFSNGKRGWITRWVRLQFSVLVDDRRQISGKATSYTELANAIEDETQPVYFYPRYKDGSGTTHGGSGDRYEVGPAWDSLRIMDAPRVGISKAAKKLELLQADTLGQVPGWASR
jgi:hypothetical protein